MPTAVSSLLALLPDPDERRRIALLDPGAGFVIHICSHQAEADRLRAHVQPDVVLAGSGPEAGVAWLTQVRRLDRDAYRILWTHPADIERAIDAVNTGDADALLRDNHVADLAVELFHHGCEQALLRRHTHSLVDELAVRNTELLSFNERLEELVAERTRHLVEAQQHLQEQQRQVVQLETQSTVTHLLRGLAHEFNNPLAAIFGYAQRLRRHLAQDADGIRRVDVILQEVEHCRTVVQQLSQLATPLVEDQARNVPADVLRLGAGRLAATGSKVPELRIDDELPQVIAANRALARVFEHILANAADAGASFVHLSGDVNGDRVRLVIENDGETPTDVVIANAVRPFFTTRAGDNHRGLGLSTAAALLREQDGTIELSRPDSGTGAATIITLPAADPVARRPSNSDLGRMLGHASPNSPATTLVVDDEPMVAEILVDVLKDAGRHTAIAGSLAEAMAELTRLDVCALVVDLHLPDGSGLDLARRALALRPALAGHIALTTGENDREVIERLVAEHGFPVLAKPFRIDDVIALAHQIS